MKQRVFCLTVLMLVFSVVSAWGVVSEIFVLGDTATPPPGYTYTGMTMYSSDKWTAKANMPTARTFLAVAEVNNKIYAIGGCNASSAFNCDNNLNTNEEYDPAANTWTVKANMPTARAGLAVAAVNGKIYAIGGNTNIDPYLTGATEEYDPVTNTWTTKANMPTPRYYLAAAAVNGKVYAIGGTSAYDPMRKTEEYDPVSNAWAVKANMPTARRDLAAAAVNGKIYAIGGWNGYGTYGTNEEYNPATNKWAKKG